MEQTSACTTEGCPLKNCRPPAWRAAAPCLACARPLAAVPKTETLGPVAWQDRALPGVPLPRLADVERFYM